MNIRAFFYLLGRHLRQHPGRTAMACAVLTLSASVMLALGGVGAALHGRVGEHLARIFPEEIVRLEAARAALGPVAMEPRPIDDRTLTALRARADVDAVWSVESARFPLSVQGELFGQVLSSDAVVYGVPRELVADALDATQPWTWSPDDPDRPCPIVGSRYFLDLYNLGLARSSGLPLLDESFVLGRHMTLVLGQSTMTALSTAQPPTSLRVRVVGLTSQTSLLGLALPAEAVRAFNRRYAPQPEPRYVQAVVRLKAGADREGFVRAVAPLGLTLSGGAAMGERLRDTVRVAGWALLALAATVLTIGLVSFYSLLGMILHARRVDLVRLRALGLTPWGAVALGWAEAATPAVMGVALAAGLNAALAWRLRAALASGGVSLGVEPSVAASLAPTPLWLGVASAVVLLATFLPVWPVMRWVARVDPAEVVRE